MNTSAGKVIAVPLRHSQAALHGALAWGVYGVVESFFLILVERFTNAAFQPLHSVASAVLLGLYPLLGAALGALTSVALRSIDRLGEDPAAVEVAGSLPLVLAVGAGQISHPAVVWRLYLPVVGLAGGLAAVHLVRIAAPRWRARSGFLVAPWTVAALLVGTPWSVDLIGERVRIAAVVAPTVAAAIVAVAYRISLRSASERGTAPSWRRRAAAYVALSAVLVSLGATPERVLRRAAPVTSAVGAVLPARPNLILITLDTVRADHLSLYGYARETTPFLIRLADAATVYAHAIASAPFTLDSHATMFTGLYPRRLPTHYDRELCPAYCELDGAYETVAEHLARSGYRTAAVVANYGFLGREFGLDQGFEIYDQRRPRAPLGGVPPYALRNAITASVALWLPAELSERVIRSAAAITDSALEIVDELADGPRPFFLFVNYMDAHEPYRPPPPYDRLFPGKDDRFRRADYQALEREVLALDRPLDVRAREHLWSQYDGAIAFLDSQLARLEEHLRLRDLLDRTALVITSDHGEAFGERNQLGHLLSVYQNQIHVPLLIRWPGQKVPARIEETVSLADLAPTLLELAGLSAPPTIDGESLLAAGAPRRRLVVSEAYSDFTLEKKHPRFRRTVRTGLRGMLKLHVSSAGGREAYDLADDPAEHSPLDLDRMELQQIEAELTEWLALFPAGVPPAAREIDDRTRERLRALGYL